MGEALFYHLTARPLESALPDLLGRTLARGWRALVRVGNGERLEALDRVLWTHDDASFLPHGTAAAPEPERQPVLLTASASNANRAEVLFLVDAADWDDFTEFERVVVMFDDADHDAVALARTQWSRASTAMKATYWRQGGDGRWSKAAESG